MRYRREEEGAFVLYSIGWNEKDDGGNITMAMQLSGYPHQDINNGDWVWGQ